MQHPHPLSRSWLPRGHCLSPFAPKHSAAPGPDIFPCHFQLPSGTDLGISDSLSLLVAASYTTPRLHDYPAAESRTFNLGPMDASLPEYFVETNWSNWR
ncbi:hypothetical protein A0H81_07565 [Grifola frondosa]|uniref:Uncharacterized protein n=1 Tax=Grifola frondosa TaxID=5627 RepID=A0A1C7M679_GRIFR|nr:hypothetical protein A0H81_07565 [Grifola frondosa]